MKEPIDNSASYRITEHVFKDKVFNWIVKRYGQKGNKWEKSDDFVWGGAIYTVIDYFWMLVFIYFVYFMGSLVYNKYGMWRGILFIAVMFLIRVNSLIRKLDQTNRLLSRVS